MLICPPNIHDVYAGHLQSQAIAGPYSENIPVKGF
jgi:hypothetical protein